MRNLQVLYITLNIEESSLEDWDRQDVIGESSDALKNLTGKPQEGDL